MASPFLTGVMTGFLEKRTERMKEEDLQAQQLGEQMKALQIKAIEKQQEKYDTWNTQVESIRSAYTKGDYADALIYASEAGFSKATADQIKAKFGLDGSVDPSSLKKMADENIPKFLEEWDSIERPDASEAAAAGLQRTRQKINGAGDIITKLFLGIGDKPDTYSPTPMRGMQEINRPFLSSKGLDYTLKQETDERKYNWSKPRQVTDSQKEITASYVGEDGKVHTIVQRYDSPAFDKGGKGGSKKDEEAQYYLSEKENQLFDSVISNTLRSVPVEDEKWNTVKSLLETPPEADIKAGKAPKGVTPKGRVMFNRWFKGYQKQVKDMGLEVHPEDIMRRSLQVMYNVVDGDGVSQAVTDKSNWGKFFDETTPVFNEFFTRKNPVTGQPEMVRTTEAYKAWSYRKPK